MNQFAYLLKRLKAKKEAGSTPVKDIQQQQRDKKKSANRKVTKNAKHLWLRLIFKLEYNIANYYWNELVKLITMLLSKLINLLLDI